MGFLSGTSYRVLLAINGLVIVLGLQPPVHAEPVGTITKAVKKTVEISRAVNATKQAKKSYDQFESGSSANNAATSPAADAEKGISKAQPGQLPGQLMDGKPDMAQRLSDCINAKIGANKVLSTEGAMRLCEKQYTVCVKKRTQSPNVTSEIQDACVKAANTSG